MEAKKVPGLHGWLWIKQGYALFRKNPLLWMVLTAIGVVGLFGISTIPVLGDPLATLLFPVLLAGFMFGCHAITQGAELELAHLFGGFRHNTQQLVALGGINLISQLLIMGVMMASGGATLVAILMSGKPVEDPAVLTQAMAGAGLAVMLGVLLFSLLLMALQFAPMLVIFNGMRAVPAMRTSLRAFLRNWLPFTVYAVALLPIVFLASMPAMLGWLVLLPILITSVYAIYQDVFSAPTVDVDAANDVASDEPSPF